MGTTSKQRCVLLPLLLLLLLLAVVCQCTESGQCYHLYGTTYCTGLDLEAYRAEVDRFIHDNRDIVMRMHGGPLHPRRLRVIVPPEPHVPVPISEVFGPRTEQKIPVFVEHQAPVVEVQTQHPPQQTTPEPGLQPHQWKTVVTTLGVSPSTIPLQTTVQDPLQNVTSISSLGYLPPIESEYVPPTSLGYLPPIRSYDQQQMPRNVFDRPSYNMKPAVNGNAASSRPMGYEKLANMTPATLNRNEMTRFRRSVGGGHHKTERFIDSDSDSDDLFESCCPSKSVYLEASLVTNIDGQKRYIVNTSTYQNKIVMVFCRYKATNCCGGGCQCRQILTPHRLLVTDPSRHCHGIFVDYFAIPTECVCRCRLNATRVPHSQADYESYYKDLLSSTALHPATTPPPIATADSQTRPPRSSVND